MFGRLILLALLAGVAVPQNTQYTCTGNACNNVEVNTNTCLNGICSTPNVGSTLQCPAGYQLRGDSCFPLNTNCNYGAIKQPCYINRPPPPPPDTRPPIRPIYTCPTDLHWNGNSCVKEIVSEPICPPNFEYNNGQCEHILSGTCPQGFKLVNAQCIFTIEQDIQCPVGFYLVDGKCVRTIPQPQCPIGYTLVNGTCQQIVEATCPNGQRPFDGKCVQESYKDVYCPYNYFWNGNQCVSHSTKICADGYNYINGRCVQEYQSKPTIKCEEGYNLIGDLCYPIQNITTSPPEIICPPDVVCDVPIPSTTEFWESINPPTTVVPPIYPVQPPILNPCQAIPPFQPGGNCPQRPIPIPLPIPIGTPCQPEVSCPYQQLPPSPCFPNRPNYPCGGQYTGIPPSIPARNPPDNVNNEITLTNNVYNNHTINTPTNVVTNNTNTIHIYTNSIRSNGKKECGSVLTITGNERRTETFGDCAENELELNEEDEAELISTPSPPCCEVHSPRQCKKEGDEWHCFHRKYNRCGDFCTKPKIYLKRRRYQYREPILIMPPVLYRRRRPSYGNLDCSGCTDGSYDCSGDCYRSDCSRLDRSCSYYEQSDFCSEYGGQGCTTEDGVFEGPQSNQ